MEKINLNKVQDISAGLTTLVEFLKQNYKSIFKVFAYYLAIPILLVSLLMAMGMSNYFSLIFELSNLEPGSFPTDIDPDNPFSMLSYMFPPSFFIAMILGLFLNILFTAVIYKYVQLYNNSPDGVVDIKQIQENLSGNCIKFTGLSIVAGIMLFVGFLMCIAPGFYLMIIISPLFIISLEENKGISDSFKRCFDLVQDKWLQTAGFLILVYLVMACLSSLIQLPITLLSVFAPIMGIEQIGTIMGFSIVISMIFGYLVNIVVYIASAIWYYNLREQKEGTALMQTIDQIGSNKEDKEEPGDNFDYFR